MLVGLLLLFSYINKKKDMRNKFRLRVFSILRKLGLLCKKPAPYVKPRLRIKHTVYPGDNVTPLEAEIHNVLSTKKSAYRSCKFDLDTRTCECGVELNKFGAYGCPSINVKKQVVNQLK